MRDSYSIRTKIMGIIALGLVISAIGVVLLANIQLRSIVDRSQQAIYEEKILTIISDLEHKFKRLQLTGQIDVYEEAFKNSIIQKLRSTYYENEGMQIYPFIIDIRGAVVMHPVLPRGNETFFDEQFIQQMLSMEEGVLDYEHASEGKIWCVIKPFEGWDWIVGFTIPDDIKYADVRALRNMLILINVVITIVALIILFVIIAKILRPIVTLTEASKAMAAGNLDQELDIQSSDELGDLASSFRKMRNAIRKHIGDLKSEINERMQAEEALRMSEEKYRILVENANDAIFIAQDGVTKFPNKKTEELTGYSAEDLAIMPFIDFIHPDDREIVMERHQRRLAGGKPVSTYSFRILDKSGQEQTVQINTVLVQWENRPATLNFLRDITQHLELESRLQQAQKMEAIGTLAGGIAHDFNNILSAILGYSELILAELPSEDPLRNNAEAILSSGKRARDLVSQILAFSRKDEQVRSSVAMHLIVKDALKLLRPAIPTTIDIQTKIDSKCFALGDPSRIHQIIMNLCTNAYQAMLETGGELKIALSQIKLEGRAAAFAQVPTGSYVKLVVADTGIGIPPDVIERIFDPYFTTKEKGKGTGLGLAAVHGIVKSHGGAILVDSEVDKGTKFEVYLPLLVDQRETKEQVESKLIGGDEQILLVDDENDILEIQSKMLDKQGYNIIAKNDAHEALKEFSGRPDQFDLVITDMTMPNMTGDKLADELKKVRSDIPIILCTGYSELISKEKAKALGINGFLMKPVDTQDLSIMIREVLDNK